MASSGIKIRLSGFEEVLKNIEKAGGDINKAVNIAVKKSADVVQSELKNQMLQAGVSNHLVNAMPPPSIEKEGNRFTAEVGYKKGTYDEKNPSDGYKVVFLNYGTPNRKKHGKIVGRGFIQKAKKKATPLVKKIQTEAFNEILQGLQNEE